MSSASSASGSHRRLSANTRQVYRRPVPTKSLAVTQDVAALAHQCDILASRWRKDPAMVRWRYGFRADSPERDGERQVLVGGIVGVLGALALIAWVLMHI